MDADFSTKLWSEPRATLCVNLSGLYYPSSVLQLINVMFHVIFQKHTLRHSKVYHFSADGSSCAQKNHHMFTVAYPEISIN